MPDTIIHMQFKYTFRHRKTGKLSVEYWTIDEMEKGKLIAISKRFVPDYELIERCQCINEATQ